jgi:hypothetical protein
MEQREAGERLEPELVRLGERLLGGIQVPDPQADLPDLVVAGPGEPRLAEREQLAGRPSGLVFGLRP